MSDSFVIPPPVTNLSNMGVAGTPNARVGTVQGAPNMIPIQIDGTGTVQPISVETLPLATDQSTDSSLKQLVEVITELNENVKIILALLTK